MQYKIFHNLILLICIQILLIISNCNGYLLRNGRCVLKCLIPMDVDIKCGSNGVTYQNLDELLCAKEYCFPNLEKAYDGECQKDSDAVDRTRLTVRPKPSSTSSYHEPPTIIPITSNSIASANNNNSNKPKNKEIIYSRIHFDNTKSESNNIANLPHSSPQLKKPSESNNKSKLPKPNSKSGSTTTCEPNDCVCEFTLSPVCGTNGVTYGNTCILKCLQACDERIIYYHDGFCGKIFFPLDAIPFFRIFVADKFQ